MACQKIVAEPEISYLNNLKSNIVLQKWIKEPTFIMSS